MIFVGLKSSRIEGCGLRNFQTPIFKPQTSTFKPRKPDIQPSTFKPQPPINMNSIDKIDALKQRTKEFALRIIKLFQALPKNEEARIVGKQLLRSATSVAANYRATCRARSEAEFFSKISIVVEEADESLFWLEILHEAEIVSLDRLKLLLQEAEEIVKIMNTVRHNRKK